MILLSLPTALGYRQAHSHAQLFTWLLGFEPGSKYLYSKFLTRIHIFETLSLNCQIVVQINIAIDIHAGLGKCTPCSCSSIVTLFLCRYWFSHFTLRVVVSLAADICNPSSWETEDCCVFKACLSLQFLARSVEDLTTPWKKLMFYEGGRRNILFSFLNCYFVFYVYGCFCLHHMYVVRAETRRVSQIPCN